MRFIDLETDYNTLSSWWKHYNFPVIPKDSLSKNGFIIDNTCAGFIYCTDSNIAWLEFIVANPSISRDQRQNGLIDLISGLTGLAKELGYSHVFTSTNHPNLEKLLVETGYTLQDRNVSHLMRSIN